jgi:hypothetical protein
MLPLFFSTRLQSLMERNDGPGAARLLAGRRLSPMAGKQDDFRDPSTHSPWFHTAFYHHAWSVVPLLAPSLGDADEDTLKRLLRLGMTCAVDACHPGRGLPEEAREAVMALFEQWATDCGGFDRFCALPVEHRRTSAKARAMGNPSPMLYGFWPFSHRMELESPGFMDGWRAWRESRQLQSSLPASSMPPPGKARRL